MTEAHRRTGSSARIWERGRGARHHGNIDTLRRARGSSFPLRASARTRAGHVPPSGATRWRRPSGDQSAGWLLATTTERAFRRADRLPPDAEVLRILEDAEPELLGEGYHVITLRAPHDRRPAPRTGSTTAIRRRTSAVLAPITYRRAPRRLAEVVSGPIRELGVTEGGAHGGICTRPDRGGNGC